MPRHARRSTRTHHPAPQPKPPAARRLLPLGAMAAGFGLLTHRRLGAAGGRAACTGRIGRIRTRAHGLRPRCSRSR